MGFAGRKNQKYEFETPIKDVIARKMSEEVGSELQYELSDFPEILMRHERVEASPGNPTVRIFGLGYRARITGGSPKLSEAHTEMLWVDAKTFKPEDYFTGGWLKGVKEYIILQNAS